MFLKSKRRVMFYSGQLMS